MNEPSVVHSEVTQESIVATIEPRAAKDILDKVTVSGYKIQIDREKGKGFEDFIVDGTLIPGIQPKVGDGIQFVYSWEITSGNFGEVLAGDYFSFPLPSDLFSYDDTNEKDLTNREETIVFGTFKVEKNKIKVVLNQTAAEKDHLEKGQVFAVGKITKAGKDIVITGPGGEKLPEFSIENPKSDGGEEQFTGSPITKTGRQLPGENKINWGIRVNTDNERKRFNKDPDYKELKNVFVVDEMKGSQTFSHLNIKSVYHTATSEGKMSENILAFSTEHTIKRKDPTPEETTIEDYRERLRGEEEPAYGVFENTVVIFLGKTIPSDAFKMQSYLINNNYKGIKDKLDEQEKAGKISAEAKEKTWEHYQEGIEDQTLDFQINLYTDVQGSPEELSNTATLIYEDGTENSNTFPVKFQKVGGSVEGIEAKALEIIKKDDKENLLPGIEFKIQKWNDEKKAYLDYQALDSAGGIIRATNEEGKILFSYLETGKYKIVEVTKDSSKYGEPIYSKSDEFEIKDEDTEGLSVIVVNPLVVLEKIDISGDKIWDDANNQAGKRPAEITVHLLANGKRVKTQIVTSETNWQYRFSDLPKFENGQEIVYTIDEDAVKDYQSSVEGFNLRNTYTPDETSLVVRKEWDDDENQDGLRPSSVIIQLYGDNQKVGETITLSERNSWRHKWENLPKHKTTGQEIQYSIKEENVPTGYVASTSMTGSTVVITNIHAAKRIDISGDKIWDDANNQAGKRPAEITVHLLANGKQVKTQIVTSETNWQYRFSDLPKFENGQEIIYTIVEDAVKDYQSSVEGFNLRNTYTPAETSLVVTKIWEDQQNAANKQPESIQVQLYANGEEYGASIFVTAAMNWTYRWMNLPILIDGQEVVYTVDEIDVAEGYSSMIEKFNSGIVITNTYKQPEYPVDSVEPVEPEQPEREIKPSEPIKPKDPSKPQKPKVPEKTKKTPVDTKLPQAGEESALWLSLLGIVLLFIVWKIAYRLRSQSK